VPSPSGSSSDSGNDGCRRIGLIGAESSGKSMLARSLAATLDAVVATEVLRDFVSREGRPPRADEQVAIMHAQQGREDHLAAEEPSHLVIGDPAALMTAIYSLAYFDDDALLPPALAHARSYDLIAWCDIDIPWQPDGIQRDGPLMRERVHNLIAGVVDHELAECALIRVSGPLPRRVDAVRWAWQQRGLSAPT
jgi:nicotinamide riboside kinase